MATWVSRIPHISAQALKGSYGEPKLSNPYVTDSDPRMTDARTASAHATSHKSGGSDPILLDELGTPTDVTTLDTSITAHGLAPKLPNDGNKYLSGTGAWTVPPSGGTPPTGTGFRHITAGVEDGASKLIDTADINASQVTLAKIANAASSSKLLGSGDSGIGAAYAEITIGSGLTMTGTTLSAAGGGVTHDQIMTRINVGF